MQTFTYYTDPGHGWIEVSIPDLMELGLQPADFSQYSYRSGDYVYLEEDCDAGVFVSTWRLLKGYEPKFREVHTDTDSIIRSYPRVK